MAGNIYHEWDGTTLIVTSDSGTSACDLKGQQGDVGIRGPQGIPGISVGGGTTVTVDGEAQTTWDADIKANKEYVDTVADTKVDTLTGNTSSSNYVYTNDAVSQNADGTWNRENRVRQYVAAIDAIGARGVIGTIPTYRAVGDSDEGQLTTGMPGGDYSCANKLYVDDGLATKMTTPYDIPIAGSRVLVGYGPGSTTPRTYVMGATSRGPGAASMVSIYDNNGCLVSAEPINDNEVATKYYVDTAVAGAGGGGGALYKHFINMYFNPDFTEKSTSCGIHFETYTTTSSNIFSNPEDTVSVMGDLSLILPTARGFSQSCSGFLTDDEGKEFPISGVGLDESGNLYLSYWNGQYQSRIHFNYWIGENCTITANEIVIEV